MTTLRLRLRLVAFGVVVAAAVGVSLVALRHEVQRQDQLNSPTSATVRDEVLDLGAVLDVPHLVFRSTSPGPTYGLVAAVPLADPGGVRSTSTLNCTRVYATAERGMCLRAERGALTTYHGQFLDGRLRAVGEFLVDGAPSRARLSADGTLAATTVFLTGHGYGTLGFSTGTTILDLAGGPTYGNLEKTFTVVIDGERNTAADLNVWGVTFPSGPSPAFFYATVATGGRTWLARGDLAARTLTSVRPDAECPSLSPDGRHIVYKKRAGSPIRWRYHVLDLASGRESALPETRSVDDQADWLDDTHVVYGLQREGTGESDVWVSAISGGTPRVLVPDAASPAVVRHAASTPKPDQPNTGHQTQ